MSEVIEEASVFMRKVTQMKQAVQSRAGVLNVALGDFARANQDALEYLETQCNLLRGRVQELEEKYEPKKDKKTTPKK